MHWAWRLALAVVVKCSGHISLCAVQQWHINHTHFKDDSVLLLERKPGVWRGSRSLHIHMRTLRCFCEMTSGYFRLFQGVCCSPKRTVQRTNIHTYHQWPSTGQPIRATHTVPSARRASPGLQRCSPATSTRLITTTRTWTWDSAQCYKFLTFVSDHFSRHCEFRRVALKLLCMPLANLDALLWMALLSASSSSLISHLCRRFNNANHWGNQGA